MKRRYRFGMLMALPVLAGVCAFAVPDDIIDEIQSKLTGYYNVHKPEKLQLMFNQPKYVGGDTAFFRGYLLSAQSLSPVIGKKVVSMKLLSADGKLHFYSRIVFQNGSAVNQFVLPKSLQPDIYNLVAYDESTTQQDKITPLLSEPFTVTGEKELRFVRENDAVEIFPEGGQLIEGTRSKVVVSASQYGAAEIVNAEDQHVADFEVSKEGTGTFMITPRAGEHYFLILKGKKHSLPPVEKDGVGIQLKELPAGDQEVLLSINNESALRGKNLYVTLTIQSKICFSKEVKFGNDTVKAIALNSNNSFGTGLLSVFSAEKKVLSERLVFINPMPVQVSVQTDKTSYRARQPVEVQLSAQNVNQKPVQADLTVTVLSDELFDQRAAGISQGLLINSDVIAAHLSQASLTVNDFLITQTWSGFQWNELISGSFPVRQNGNVSSSFFKGKLTSGNAALPDSTLITLYLNRSDFVYGLYVTEKSGQFQFPLFKDFGDEQIFYAVTHKGKKVDASIVLDSAVVPVPQWVAASPENGNDSYSDFAKKRNIVRNSFLYYLNQDDTDAEPDSWMESDFDIILDRYEPFANMPDLLSNIIKVVRYRKNGEADPLLRVFMKEKAMYAPSEPMYIIDGVMTDNTQYFLSMNTSDISKIGIMRSEETLHRFGELGKNGIIEVATKPSVRPALPSNAHELFVTGINKTITPAVTARASENQAQVPDLRSNLYWNPKVVTNAEGKAMFSFYTGDATGNFTIRMEGITTNGIPFTKEVPFIVSYEKP